MVMPYRRITDIEEGTPVRVYWNLHKLCYSVQTRQPFAWRVHGHASSLQLNDVTFHVSQAGNKRVRKEGKKNVHAFVKGTWTEGWDKYPDFERVHYNPYQYTQFMLGKWPANRMPIHSAPQALLVQRGKIWASQ